MDIFHTANTGDRSWPGTRLTIERRIRRRSELTESIILDSEPTIYSLQEVEERGREGGVDIQVAISTRSVGRLLLSIELCIKKSPRCTLNAN